jgi:hypothetical protein
MPFIMPSFYKLSRAVQHELLELHPGTHITLILNEKNPLFIHSMLQLLPAFSSSLGGDAEKPHGSISPGKIHQVISVTEGLEQLNIVG